jgi:hypothetical protein
LRLDKTERSPMENPLGVLADRIETEEKNGTTAAISEKDSGG